MNHITMVMMNSMPAVKTIGLIFLAVGGATGVIKYGEKKMYDAHEKRQQKILGTHPEIQ